MNKGTSSVENSNIVDNLEFRPLRAEEIEVKFDEPETTKVYLMLYKNARVDMTILDEVVGRLNWQREYYEEHGLLFCRLGIRHPQTKEWIWKSDTGTPSKKEPEKGLVSDAFKRAAICFGIGRELYTGPKISIDVDKNKDIYKGKYSQSFKVSQIEYSNGVITNLAIVDRLGRTRYVYPSEKTTFETNSPYDSGKRKPIEQTISTNKQMTRLEMLDAFCDEQKEKCGVDGNEVERMRDWFLKPDKNNPLKKRIETWTPEPSFDEKMWQWWINHNKYHKSF